MRGTNTCCRTIIRLNRKNDFDRVWVFLAILEFMACWATITAYRYPIFHPTLFFIHGTIILTAFAYQGVEVVKEPARR